MAMVRLTNRAVVTVLYRPYVLDPAVVANVNPDIARHALDRARQAAARTNAVLERIIDLDAVHLLKPMMQVSYGLRG